MCLLWHPAVAYLLLVRPRKSLDMDTPSPKQPTDTTRFVEPSLRPSPEHPSGRRIAFGVALLLGGLVAILFGFLGFRTSNLDS